MDNSSNNEKGLTFSQKKGIQERIRELETQWENHMQSKECTHKPKGKRTGNYTDCSTCLDYKYKIDAENVAFYD